MAQSKQTQPHYYLTLDIDMTAAMAFREQLNAAAGEAQRVSVNDLIVKACALALQRHPKFNAEFAIRPQDTTSRINIDIGIALDEGLIAPAHPRLRRQVARAHRGGREGPDRARARKQALRAEEYARARSRSPTSARTAWRR